MKKIWKMFCWIVLVLALVLAFVTLWLRRVWGGVSVESLLYTMFMPTDGTDPKIIWSCIKTAVLPVIGLTVLYIVVYCLARRNATLKKITDIVHSVIPFILLGCAFCYMNSRYNVVKFFKNYKDTTEIYQNGIYTAPESVKIEGSDTNNLIIVYLESLENSFFSKELGGANENNAMAELARLNDENISFSNTSLNGGPLEFYGTTWSTASYVAHMSGLPMNTLAEYGTYLDFEFMPGAYMLGDVLQEDYIQDLVLGQEAAFGGIETLFKNHGNYTVCGTEMITEQYHLPEEAECGWGVKDFYTFEVAKERINRAYQRALAKNKKFNVNVITIDLHTPDGITCPYCPDEFPTDYENICACQSRLVEQFVQWCKEQEWYEKTTIVLTGDHTTRANQHVAFVPKDYERTTYNCIINSKVTTEHTKKRVFTRMDMYPTILAAMGYTIEGDRLALGTNLFSDRPTLTEEYGFDYMNEEVGKSDTAFNRKIYHTLVF